MVRRDSLRKSAGVETLLAPPEKRRNPCCVDIHFGRDIHCHRRRTCADACSKTARTQRGGRRTSPAPAAEPAPAPKIENNKPLMVGDLRPWLCAMAS
jgi:hypothetical protein